MIIKRIIIKEKVSSEKSHIHPLTRVDKTYPVQKAQILYSIFGAEHAYVLYFRAYMYLQESCFKDEEHCKNQKISLTTDFC